MVHMIHTYIMHMRIEKQCTIRKATDIKTVANLLALVLYLCKHACVGPGREIFLLHCSSS